MKGSHLYKFILTFLPYHLNNLFFILLLLCTSHGSHSLFIKSYHSSVLYESVLQRKAFFFFMQVIFIQREINTLEKSKNIRSENYRNNSYVWLTYMLCHLFHLWSSYLFLYTANIKLLRIQIWHSSNCYFQLEWSFENYEIDILHTFISHWDIFTRINSREPYNKSRRNKTLRYFWQLSSLQDLSQLIASKWRVRSDFQYLDEKK